MYKAFRAALQLVLLISICVEAFGQNATPVQFVKPQWFDANGQVLVGGLLYTCTTGLSCPGNPLATYTDSTAGTQNTNPVVLDSAGRASVWLVTGTYRLVMKNSAGSTLWTVDGVVGNGATPFTGSGSANSITKFTGPQVLGNSNLSETGGVLNINEPIVVQGTTTFNSLAYTWPATQSTSTFLQNNGSGLLTWSSFTTSGLSGGWTQSGTTIYATIITSDIVVGATSANSYTGNTSIIAYGGKLVTLYALSSTASDTLEISVDATSVKLNSFKYGAGTVRPIDIQMSAAAIGRIQVDGTFSWGTTTDSAYLFDLNGSSRLTGIATLGDILFGYPHTAYGNFSVSSNGGAIFGKYGVYVATDTTNGSFLGMSSDGATVVDIRSGAVGAGSVLPLIVEMDSTIVLKYPDTSGIGLGFPHTSIGNFTPSTTGGMIYGRYGVYSASDTTNGSYIGINNNGSTVASLRSAAVGAGTTLPLSIIVGSSTVAKFAISGNDRSCVWVDNGLRLMQLSGGAFVDGGACP